MNHHDFRATWAARLADPTDTEAAILAALDAAPRGPQAIDDHCRALYLIREHWTGPAPTEEPEGDVSITGADLSLADLEAAAGDASPRRTGLGPNGKRALAEIGGKRP